MDRISGLTDDLLVKILSFLPTKVAVSTCILSKRWECLHMWLPNLAYLTNSDSDETSLRCFLNRTLPLHRASVIESFRLRLCYSCCKPEDVRLWVLIAVSHCVRKLDITYRNDPNKGDILPSNLYASKSLAVLKLTGTITLDVPRMVSLPCLKTLKLQEVTGIDGEPLQRFLSICPVLENLWMEFYDGGNNKRIIVIVPSLQSLSLYASSELTRLEINTPSLKYLKIKDLDYRDFSCSFENMPNLEAAYVQVDFPIFKKLITAITSVKRLTLCSQAMYAKGVIFNQLEHLKFCDCHQDSSKLLTRLLKISPNLRVLDIFHMDHEVGSMESWKQPSIVPTCLMSSLQTFKWSGYGGSPHERGFAVYILQNARNLKIAKFSTYTCLAEKHELLKELSLSSRASTTCQLVFD